MARNISDAGGDTDRIARLNLGFERDVEDLDIRTARRAAEIERSAARDAERFNVAEAEARAEAGVDPIFNNSTALAVILKAFEDEIAAINKQLGLDTDAVLAEGTADRAATAAAVTERGTAYDVDIAAVTAAYRAERLDITDTEAAAIETAEGALDTELAGIDEKVDTLLAEVRAEKVEFDNQVFRDIRDIESQAAIDIGKVREDAAQTRIQIEALAAEARNNAWKDAILKVANVGVRVTGGIVGGLVAGPAGAAAGERIGGVLGGLVEDAGQELFHDPQNDLLAFRAGQQAARGASPAFSPNETQRQNAADFSHYFGEGYAAERQNEDVGSESSPIIVQLVLNDRVVQELSVRQEELRLHDRLV